MSGLLGYDCAATRKGPPIAFNLATVPMLRPRHFTATSFESVCLILYGLEVSVLALRSGQAMARRLSRLTSACRNVTRAIEERNNEWETS